VCLCPSIVSDVEPPQTWGFHVAQAASNIQKLKEEFGAEEEAEGRGVPVVHALPADRGMTIVALVGHFCIQRELFGEHVVAPHPSRQAKVLLGEMVVPLIVLLSPKLFTFTPKLILA